MAEKKARENMKNKNLFGILTESPDAPKDGAQYGFPNTDSSSEEIRQYSNYDKSSVPMPDNNPFWEDGNNPLSSKGN